MRTASRHAAHVPRGPSLPTSAAIFASPPTWSSAPNGHTGLHRHTRVLSLGAAIAVGTLVGLASGLLLLAAFLAMYLSI